jgi:hypothetical protein
MEMTGDVTSQRRWEAYDKLGTFGIYAIGIVLAIQVRRRGSALGEASSWLTRMR